MNIEKSIEIIKALGDSSRLRILKALLEKPYYVEELAARLNLGAPTVSFHLKKLEQADFVKKEKEQYYVMFHAKEEALDITLRELVQIEDKDNEVQDKRLEEYREKVLKTFFRNGKLLRLPSQEKKRRIILDEFAGRFLPDRKYCEAEVNEIINRLYEDHCTIRRELVDLRIMKRSGGEYRLLKQTEPKPVSEYIGKKEKGKNKMDRKAELKKAYKMNPRQGGIYQIKNLVNGKTFIGSGPNVEAQINKQLFMLKLNSMPVEELQKDWNKFGEDKFEFTVLDRLKRKDETSMKDYKSELLLLEEMWIEKLKVTGENGYNQPVANNKLPQNIFGR